MFDWTIRSGHVATPGIEECQMCGFFGKGSAVSVLIAQSDLNHSRKLVDAEFVIERGANVAASVA